MIIINNKVIEITETITTVLSIFNLFYVFNSFLILIKRIKNEIKNNKMKLFLILLFVTAVIGTNFDYYKFVYPKIYNRVIRENEKQQFGNKEGLPTGGGPGQPCTNDTDCWGNACGRITATPGAPYLCCPSNGDVYFQGVEYCTGMAPGNDCWINAMCGSYNCSGCDYGQQRGTCT